MSDGQKYYTPSPEDIRVGFECEVQVDFDAWEHDKVSAESKVFELAMVLIETNGIRVPYLTAEQIEAEGWKITKSDDLSIIFTNDRVVFHYGHDGYNLTVLRMEPEDTMFMGKCRCKNDLRLICKMIGIETTKNNAI